MDAQKLKEKLVFLLMFASSYPLPIDQVEWTDPKFYHQN